jgi:hypothetical protein
VTPPRSLTDRALAAFPLVLLYLLFCCLYVWEATGRLTPTIFSDELELTQISRSIAETGQAARRGEPYGFQTIYSIVLAPVWWIDDTESAYAAAKYVGVLVMTATLFPAYALARMVVSRWWALFAAAGAVAIPGLSYAPFLFEEPLAYPFATLALWLIARFVAARTYVTLAPAAAVCVVAPFVRTQLAVLGASLLLCLLAVGWSTERMRRWRTTWTAWDWLGLSVLGVGALVVLSAFLGHQSETWYETTGFWKGRVFEYGLWAVGALALGTGVLPLVGGLAALVAKGDRAVRALAITAGSAFITFGIYTAVKAAYIANHLGTRIVERNLIYLAPLLFAGTAVLLERPRARLWAVAVAGAFTLYLLVTTPFIQDYPYGDAPSLSMAALANRELRWDSAAVERALVVTLVVGIALLAGRLLLRGRASQAVAVVAAVGVVGWSLTAEIYAAIGNNDSAELLYGHLPKPPDWVDEATGSEGTVYFGQSMDDQNGVWLMEFWNRSLKKVWSFDGTAPGPGPTLSPDLAAPDGTLSPSPGVPWAVAENDVELDAQKVGEPRGSLQLYKLDGPLRLVKSSKGVLGDGWMQETASFNQFAAPPGASPRGFVKVFLVRPFCAKEPPAKVVVRIGGIVITDHHQPALSPRHVVRRGLLPWCNKGLTFFVPIQVPFRVEIEIDPTFSPAALDSTSPDTRQLSAQYPSVEFVPLYSR